MKKNWEREQTALLFISMASALLFSIFAPGRSVSQEVNSQSSDQRLQAAASTQEKSEVEQLRDEIKKLKEEDQAKFEELKKENQAQDAKIAEQAKQAEANSDNLQMDSGEDFANSEQKFFIYGFFDVDFMYTWFKSNSIQKGLGNEGTTYLLPNLNFYFKSQMTETLSALVELRFTFLPLGNEKSLEVIGTATKYDRDKSEVTAPMPYEKITLGGVAIERVVFTYQPLDLLGIIAGYYMTPYGIWNVDHGSPVLIPIREPYLSYKKIVPPAQLGIQVFGRTIPANRLYFDYAVTLSNGRGPMDTVEDLDNSRGMGLRLKLTYEGEKFTLAGGAYGYFGEYTDLKKVIMNFSPFTVVQETTEKYKEYIIATDLLIEFYGLRLQSEYVRRLAVYSKRPERAQEYGTGFQPDYIIQAFYGLVAWEIPVIQRYLRGMRVSPYFMLEWNNSDNTVPGMKSLTYTFGLNLKPSPFVTIKVEGVRLKSMDSDLLNGWFAGAQLAVSF